MLADSGAEWVAIRSAAILGRGVDNWVRRVLAAPLFPDIDGSPSHGAGRAQRRRAPGFRPGDPRYRHRQWAGEPCRARGADLREIAGVLGRPVVPGGSAAG